MIFLLFLLAKSAASLPSTNPGDDNPSDGTLPSGVELDVATALSTSAQSDAPITTQTIAPQIEQVATNRPSGADQPSDLTEPQTIIPGGERDCQARPVHPDQEADPGSRQTSLSRVGQQDDHVLRSPLLRDLLELLREF
jgi:hypothetical protein